MKKLLLGLATLTVLLIAAVIVAPSFIDWTSYRNGIAAEIERVLNRRVIIDGAVDASIVPTPRLSLRGVRLGNLPGASSPTMAQADALEVRVAFWPLLSGRVVVTSVVLRKPVIELEVLADGRPNWLFADPASANARARANPTEGLPDGVQFENAVITDGTIVYRDARTGAEDRMEGVNARFAAGGFYGPLRAAGELRYGALPLRFSVSAGRLDPRGLTATPINLSAEIPADRRGQPARGSASFTGTLRLPESGLQFGGQLKLSGADMADFVTALGGGEEVPLVLSQAFNLEGAVELKDDVFNGNDLAVHLGETRAQGAVSASFTGDEPQLDIALSVGRVDLDAWLAAAAKKKTALAASDSAAPREPEEFILPLGLRVTLDVAADALTYRGGAMRQVKLAAEMADGVIDIHQLALQLPGGTNGLFNGKLLAAEGRPRLDGFAEVSSEDFRSLLGWLDMDASSLPAGRLNKVSATSHVGWTSDMLDLGDLDMRFDNTSVTGALVVALRERPALGVNLIVDQLHLDSYLPGATQSASEVSALATSQAAAAVIPLTALTEFDANLRLRVDQLGMGTTTARGINLDGTLINGVLTMRKLAISDLAGGTASLAGTVEGFDDKLRTNLQFDVEASQPTVLLRTIGVALPLPDAALSPLSASGRLSGGRAGYKINGVVNAAVTSLAVVGDMAFPPQGPARYAFDLSLDHPNYAGLLRLFDPDFVPERESQARVVSLNTKLEHKGQGYNLSAISGVFGPLTLEGNAALAFDGPLPRINAQLTTGDIDTRNFLSAQDKPRAAGRAGAASAERWSTESIEFALAKFVNGSLNLRGKSLRHGEWAIGEPRSEIILDAGGIEVKQLAGQMLGGQLSARGRLVPSGRSDGAMALDYSVSLSGADLGSSLFEGTNIDLSGGRFDLSVEGAGMGSSQAALIAGMSGNGSFAVENSVLKGFDLQRLNARFASTESPGELVRLIRSTMANGSTNIESLRGDFTITDGIIGVDDLVIQSPAGEVRALVAADLPQWRLDATAEVRLAGNANGPPFDMQLSGPLDAPKRDFDSDALQTFVLEESVRRAPSRPAPQATPRQRQPTPQPAAPQPTAPRPAAPQPSPQPTPQRAPAMTDVTPPSAPAQPAQSQRAPRVLSVSPNVPAAPSSQGAPAAAPDIPTQPRPRVLNVSPNAPAAAPQGAPAATPETPAQPRPRVLSVSPNAPGAAPSPNAPRVLNVSPNAVVPGHPAPDSSLPPERAPKIISISPNAAPRTTPPNTPPGPGTERVPAQAVEPGRAESPPQPANPDSESFARDILRDLGPQP